jgi:CRISPR/Cas system-associated endonuclease/helicase Cas3
LFTEAAPISSIVQRLGRVNRYGKKEKSMVYIYYPRELYDVEEDRRKRYPYSLEEIKKTWIFLESLDNFKEGNFIRRIDEEFTKDFYEELIKEENICQLYKDVFENRESDSNVHWFLQSAKEEKGRELLEFRESVTTLIIPYGEIIENNLRKEINSLLDEYNKLRKENSSNYNKWREFFAKVKLYAVPAPLWLLIATSDLIEEKSGFPVVERLPEKYEYKYFREYGFVNLEKLRKFGVTLENDYFF